MSNFHFTFPQKNDNKYALLKKLIEEADYKLSSKESEVGDHLEFDIHFKGQSDKELFIKALEHKGIRFSMGAVSN